MKVLVACEFSGIVRDAFKAKGHNAWSCDLLPTEKPGQHIQGDVLEILGNGWDLMIAHPPCTYLSGAGLHWNKKRQGRQKKTIEAFNFFMNLYNAPINKVCVENPVGYINSHFRQANQIINPYFFGEPQQKRTCLWLKNLPKLYWHKENTLFEKKTAVDKPKPNYVDKSGKKRYFTDKLSPSKDRWKIRSRTFQGIADAMAEQWG